MNKTTIALIFILCLISACGNSSSDHELKHRLDEAIEEVVRTGGGSTGLPMPGAGVDYFTPPNSHLSLPHGMANMENNVKMSARALFHVGSITKTFTAAWIMQLDQEGTLSIEEPNISAIPTAIRSPYETCSRILAESRISRR